MHVGIETANFCTRNHSSAVRKLMKRRSVVPRSIRKRSTAPFKVYGQEPQTIEFGTTRPVPQSSSTRDKDKIWHGEVFSEGVRSSSPYRRLKLVMDYWCALWFWPLEQADELPDREEFLFDLSSIPDANLVITRQPEQADIFAPTMPKEGEESLISDLGRRNALVDIDVLVALHLGMELDALITIFQVQFPAMQAYEHDTWYDQHGRIIFTNSRGLTGIGLVRKSKDEPSWEDVKDMQHGTVHQSIIDDSLQGGPVERTITYVAPFTRCDREDDYRTAWTEFEKRGMT